MKTPAEHYDEAMDRADVRMKMAHAIHAASQGHWTEIEREECISAIEAAVVEERARRAVFGPENTAPEYRRVLIYGHTPAGHDEMAVAWKDRVDGRWYFAPQGGLVPFTVERWCEVPQPPTDLIVSHTNAAANPT